MSNWCRHGIEVNHAQEEKGKKCSNASYLFGVPNLFTTLVSDFSHFVPLFLSKRVATQYVAESPFAACTLKVLVSGLSERLTDHAFPPWFVHSDNICLQMGRNADISMGCPSHTNCTALGEYIFKLRSRYSSEAGCVAYLAKASFTFITLHNIC